MSDYAKPIAAPSSPRTKWTLALYAAGAVLVILTFAYIDGGEEPLHRITQAISLEAHQEAQP